MMLHAPFSSAVRLIPLCNLPNSTVLRDKAPTFGAHRGLAQATHSRSANRPINQRLSTEGLWAGIAHATRISWLARSAVLRRHARAPCWAADEFDAFASFARCAQRPCGVPRTLPDEDFEHAVRVTVPPMTNPPARGYHPRDEDVPDLTGIANERPQS